MTAGGGERAATMVETALVLPLFFLFFFGLIDLGLGVFQTSQAAAAARDGARYAILHPADTADIQEEATRRLAGQPVDAVTVACTGPTGAGKSCAAALTPGEDRVRVEVGWEFRPLTFVGAPFAGRVIEGSATMTVVGTPVP